MKRIAFFFLKPLSFIPALVMMYVIFSFSSQTGAESSALSTKVTKGILIVADRLTDQNWTEEDIDARVGRYEHYVRKLAHMTEYCVLAITIALPLYVYGLRGTGLLILVGFLCIAFAASDEYHQSMVANRGPSARDVMIDTCGSVIGIMLVRIFSWIALGGQTRKRRHQ